MFIPTQNYITHKAVLMTSAQSKQMTIFHVFEMVGPRSLQVNSKAIFIEAACTFQYWINTVKVLEGNQNNDGNHHNIHLWL